MSGYRAAVRLSTTGVAGRDEFAALRAALAADGWDLRIDTQTALRRSAVAELVVHLLDGAPSLALDGLETILIDQVRASLTRQHNHQGRIVIYGADEAVLRLCEVTSATGERSPTSGGARQGDERTQKGR